jgi:drug/metabolite transporter (DMT)-like permease
VSARVASEAGARRAPAAGVLAALGILYFVWGSTYLGIRLALPAFPPLLLAGLRFVLAGGALYLALRLRGAPHPPRATWAAGGLVGLLLVGANALVSAAEQWVSSGVTAVVVASVPLWVGVASALAGERPSRGEWLGIAVGLAGVALLQTGGDLRGSPLGAALLVLSTWCWAAGSIAARRLPMAAGLMASAVEMLVGGGVLLAAGLARGDRIAPHPPAGALLAFAYLVVFGSLVAFTAYGFLLRRVRPALATSYAYVNPAVALGLGMLFGERPPPQAFAALALVVAGVALVVARAARR